MPFWRTTHNIFKAPWESDYFDPNWMNYNTIQTPPKTNWDYKREMTIEDVNLWEEIAFNPSGIGVYAAWDPYAEFYMITNMRDTIETFYGPEAAKKVYHRAKELGQPLNVNKVWVDDEDLWLHMPNQEFNKKLIL